MSVDDTNDADLLQSPFTIDDDIEIVNTVQVPIRRPFIRRVRQPSSTCTTSGKSGEPFHGDGINVGTFTMDMSPHGLGGVSSRECRVNEVCRCESTIQLSCINLQMSVPPFLTHTFEELCWQAREERKPVMVLLLCPSACLHHGKLNEATLRVFQKVLEQCKEGWLFWTAKTTSKDGQKASDIEDDDWLSRSTTSICERATFLIESLVIEREKLARWRAEKQEQDGQFAECEINNQSLDMPPGNINDPEREKEKEEEVLYNRKYMTGQGAWKTCPITLPCNDRVKWFFTGMQ
ncbi:uncharacterized protein LOC144636473 [Oculina patagonica]